MSLPRISPRPCNNIYDHYLQDIEKFIREERKALGDEFYRSKKQRFAVFNKAFDMLIEESANFKSLLADINGEYKAVIKAVEHGEQQRECILRDIKASAGESQTLENYEKRIKNLECKAKLIKNNNHEFKAKLGQSGEKIDKSENDGVNSSGKITLQQQHYHILPGLKMEEQTDIKVLSSCLVKLQEELHNVNENMKIKYFPKERKATLECNLREKERSRNHICRYNKLLKKKLGNLTIAVEAAKSYTLTCGSAPKCGLADAILKALNDNEKLDPLRAHDPIKDQLLTDDDDPLKKKECERLVSYVEHFNDLLEFSQYEAAAIHAATSPRGILRTPQVMQQFKDAQYFKGTNSPLFLYCEALMSTSILVNAEKEFKLPFNMSLECISCALKESGLSLAIHWLNNPCINTSLALADLFVRWCQCDGYCVCKCHAIAEGIYRMFSAHEKVVSSLAKQGKHFAAVEYGKTRDNVNVSHYKTLLVSNPTTFYATLLVKSNINSPKSGISFCGIVNVLLANNQEILFSFLEEVYSTGISNSKGKNFSINDLIFLEKSSDEMTNEKWMQVIDLCYSRDCHVIATEIHSTLLVRRALNHASISCSMDYIS